MNVLHRPAEIAPQSGHLQGFGTNVFMSFSRAIGTDYFIVIWLSYFEYIGAVIDAPNPQLYA
jgi:hypothetical protein